MKYIENEVHRANCWAKFDEVDEVDGDFGKYITRHWGMGAIVLF